MSSKHLDSAHINETVREMIAEEPERYVLRLSKGGSIKVTDKDTDEAVWYYRGYEISLDESIPAGYYGRYKWGGWRRGGAAGSLTELLAELDRDLARKEA